MHRVLEGLLWELDALDAEAQRLAGEHSAAVLATRPAQGGWSVAECWAHVAKTVEAYLPKLDQATSTGRAAGLTGEGPYSYGLVGRFFLWILEPPVRVRVPAPAILHPGPGPDPGAALAEYLKQHQALRDRIRAAEGLDLGKVRVTSPASDKLKFPLGVGFGAMAAHGRRHAWQAQQVLGKLKT